MIYDKYSDQWETPQWLFKELDEEFDIGVDLCCNEENNKRSVWIGDYLALGPITEHFFKGKAAQSAFMNPPYSKPLPFIERAWSDSKHIKIVCLIKCDPSTKTWAVFWDYDSHKPKAGCEVRFIRKRLKFERDGVPADATAAFPSAIVIMDRRIIK